MGAMNPFKKASTPQFDTKAADREMARKKKEEEDAMKRERARSFASKGNRQPVSLADLLGKNGTGDKLGE